MSSFVRIVRLGLDDVLQVRDAEDLRCMALSAAECEGAFIHDGSFVAMSEIQFLYKLVREALFSTPVSSRVSYHLSSTHPAGSSFVPLPVTNFNHHDSHDRLID